MTTLSKTLIAAAAFAAVATSAFSQVPWELIRAWPTCTPGPGKCRRWPWRQPQEPRRDDEERTRKSRTTPCSSWTRANSTRPRVCSTRPAISICPDPGALTALGRPLRGGPDRKIDSRMPEQDMNRYRQPMPNVSRRPSSNAATWKARLREQLEAYAAAGREIFPAYGEAVDRLVVRLNENGGGENAPRPGEVMPPFVLPDETGRLVSLKSLIDKGPVAVMFYRGHWCPYCRLNVRAVIQAQDRIKALGAQTVAIMPETQAYAEKFKSEADAPFPVLTDLDNGYALSLNLAIWLGTEIQRLLSYQDMSGFHGNDGWVLPIPATFVVGRDGLVKARFVDPDFRKRMEIDDLIAALKSASEERAAPALIASGVCGLVDELLPVGAAQHAHHGGRHRRPFAPGNAVEVHGAARVQSLDGGAFERRRDRRRCPGPRRRRYRLRAIRSGRVPRRFHGCGRRRGRAREARCSPALRVRNSFATAIARREDRRSRCCSRSASGCCRLTTSWKFSVNSGQVSSRSQSSPISAAMPSSASPFLRNSPTSLAVAAQESELQAVELPFDLVEMRNQQRQVDGMGQRDPERADFAALERRGQLRARRWRPRSIA